MPNLNILSANVAAARDRTKLAAEDFESFRQYALETRAITAPAAATSAGGPWPGPCR
jgi:hypothetical protein